MRLIEDSTREFLSCDWGTSSFRLRWISGPELSVVHEIHEPTGARALHDEAIRLGGDIAQTRPRLFSTFLRRHLEHWTTAGHRPPAPLPLIVSGMASSSIGWLELPYAPAPTPVDGSRLRVETLAWDKPDWVGTTSLVSGIATHRDIMRGEEVEILGLLAAPELASMREQAVVVLPGTHSKHVRIQAGAVHDFRTVMTGELFDVLGRHSILRASVDPTHTASSGEHAPIPEPCGKAFDEGVLEGGNDGLTAALFRVRARTVLDHCPVDQNTWFLSGLLIGAELRLLLQGPADLPILMAGTPRLSALYSRALTRLAGDRRRWMAAPPSALARATIQGHALILQALSHRPPA